MARSAECVRREGQGAERSRPRAETRAGNVGLYAGTEFLVRHVAIQAGSELAAQAGQKIRPRLHHAAAQEYSPRRRRENQCMQELGEGVNDARPDRVGRGN